MPEANQNFHIPILSFACTLFPPFRAVILLHADYRTDHFT